MSVDTYLKGKNLSRYNVVEQGDVKILVAPSLIKWAKAVQLGSKRFLIWESFDVELDGRRSPEAPNQRCRSTPT